MASISNIRKKIRFSILLKIKLGLFQRAFLDFGKYFAFFKNFSVFKLGITNSLLNILTIIIAFI